MVAHVFHGGHIGLLSGVHVDGNLCGETTRMATQSARHLFSRRLLTSAATWRAMRYTQHWLRHTYTHQVQLHMQASLVLSLPICPRPWAGRKKESLLLLCRLGLFIAKPKAWNSFFSLASFTKKLTLCYELVSVEVEDSAAVLCLVLLSDRWLITTHDNVRLTTNSRVMRSCSERFCINHASRSSWVGTKTFAFSFYWSVAAVSGNQTAKVVYMGSWKNGRFCMNAFTFAALMQFFYCSLQRGSRVASEGGGADKTLLGFICLNLGWIINLAIAALP